MAQVVVWLAADHDDEVRLFPRQYGERYSASLSAAQLAYLLLHQVSVEAETTPARDTQSNHTIISFQRCCPCTQV